MITDSRLVRATDFAGFDAAGKKSIGIPGGTADAPYVDIAGKDITQIFYNTSNLGYQRFTLANRLQGVRGSAYDPERQRIILVEWFSGTLSSVDVNTGEYKVLGNGYTNPIDVVLTADHTTAYITEDIGTLLRVDLASGKADRSAATLISSGMSHPCQIALDETNRKAYVVETGLGGRLLSIQLAGLKPGQQTLIEKGFINAFGLLLANDGVTVYVCENGDGPVHGRLTRINVITHERKILFDELDLTFFLHWENEAQNSILVMQWDPDVNGLARLDVTGNSREPQVLEERFQETLWGVLILPNDRYLVCSDTKLTMFATTLLIPKIVDVGGSVFSRHFQEEFDRWKQAGEVLEPHTKYRLAVTTTVRMLGDGNGPLASLDETKTTTEYAYFRTAGPPGAAQLTAPAGSEGVIAATQKYVSSLDDLSRYVRKTMPATVEPTPVNPVPSQVAYRAYDIGLEFDENYVDLMYRIGRRDLSIHVHDGNGAIRDDNGHRLILTNQWGQAETITFRDHEERWISLLGAGGCNLIPIPSIVTDTTFNASTIAHVLPPSSLCEARLVPALLHDAFDGYTAGANGPEGKFGRWQVRDLAGPDRSEWKITPADADSELSQTKNATSMLVWTNAPPSELPDTDKDQPLNWTDYRMTVYLQFNDVGRAGVVWRYRDAGKHYRFVMDRTTPKCEIFRVVDGVPVSLANTTSFTPPSGNDTFPITVEVTGSTFNVYHESELNDTRIITPILSVTEATIESGSVGFYTSGPSGARFTDIYVDDFRMTTPVVYRFSFLSSRFKNFKDQMDSFEDKSSVSTIADGANAAPFVSAAKPDGSVLADAESRAFDGLVALVPGVAATPVVRVTRVEQLGKAIAFLVQSPEPLDWKRTSVKLLRADFNDPKYNEVQIGVLRKADGSGLMIVSPSVLTPSGSLLPEGDYRLVFTYRRDNRTKDQNSDVLSEAGDKSPEVATLDLPWGVQQQKVGVDEIDEMLVLA